MNLKDLVIEEEAFDIFVALDATQKIQFLADAFDFGIDDAIQTQLHDIQSGKAGRGIALVQLQVIQSGPYTLNVMSVGDIIILNSDNLRVIRKFVRNMWTNGHMMIRRPDIRKSKTQNMYKYFMAYQHIGNNGGICDN